MIHKACNVPTTLSNISTYAAQVAMTDLRFFPLLFSFLYLMVQSSEAATRFPMAKPGCNDTCGNVTIPYPFGIGPGCALSESYTILCTDPAGDFINGSKPYLGLQPRKSSQSIMEVLEVSLSDQTVTINYPISQFCSDEGRIDMALVDTSLAEIPFFFSRELNKLMLLGCGNALLKYQNGGPVILSGCTSMCNSANITGCYGINCCQASIPYYLSQYSLHLKSSQNFTSRICAYAFLVDQKWNMENYLNPPKERLVYAPVVWSWPLQNYSDIHAISGCSPKKRTLELESRTINTYQCECRTLRDATWFYQINPYLDGACKHAISQIRDGGKKTSAIVGATVGVGVLILMITIFSLYGVVKKRCNNKRKEKFFKRMLQQQLSTDDIENTNLFTAKELNKATDGFNENRILGQGGQGTVYKGMLNDGRIVAIKKAKNVDESRFKEFVNEVVILSQVNHRNVVKLLGCCLETEVPLLVYEFIPNGTLFSLIHSGNDDEFPLTWNLRVRIATEVAGALAYLHSAISIPIFHRDIKSSNILLDEKYIAKVSDFGTSRSVAIDKTHVTTLVKGTFGYVDPEYFQSSQYTEKSDVYSFGVVLVEIITRQKPVSSTGTGENGYMNLAVRFLKSMNQNSLKMILDHQLADEGNEEEVIAVAKIAQQCLNSTRERRPTMKEVAIELESIKMSKGDSTIQANCKRPSCIEEGAVLISDMDHTWTIGSGSVSDMHHIWTTGSEIVKSDLDAKPLMYNTV